MCLLLTFNGGMCDENLILFMKPPDVLRKQPFRRVL